MTTIIDTRQTAARVPRSGSGRLACQDPGGPDFTTPDVWELAEAAAVCATCPVADFCRATARQFDQAYRSGTDLYGAYGCWGGWWFQPGKPPHRILHTDDDTITAPPSEDHLCHSEPRRAA